MLGNAFETPDRRPWSTDRVWGSALRLPKLSPLCKMPLLSDRRPRASAPRNISTDTMVKVMHMSIPRKDVTRFANDGLMFAYGCEERSNKYDRQQLHKHFEVLFQLLKINPSGLWLPLQLHDAIKEFEQQVELNLIICYI